MAMRRVANQEDPPVPEFLRQDSLHRPAGDLVDLHGQIADAERGAHVLFDLLVGEVLRAFALITDVEDPLLAVRTPVVCPIGTSTASSLMAGHQIQRISTSGSGASFE